jgi:polysaccharide pyruvyl transferase WcaK-like protein
MHEELVLPWGIFGSGNIGDEAMFQGFAELIREQGREPAQIWVASKNPSHVSQIVPDFRYYKAQKAWSPLQWWALRRSLAYLIVGDTPVMDYLGAWPLSEIAGIVSMAAKRKKRIACLGVGTEKLLDARSIARLNEQIAPGVAHWTVRTEEDRARLRRYGVDDWKVTVAADLAWLVPSVDASFGTRYLHELGFDGRRPLVGVNVTNDRWSREQVPGLLSVVAEVLDSLISECDIDVMLFPNDVREGFGFDSWALRHIMDLTTQSDRMFLVPNKYWHPQQAMSFVACCAVTLTMRYHFALFSALQGVPFVSLSRLTKAADLCRDLSWPYQLALVDARAENLRSMLDDCINDRAHLATSIRVAARNQIARARRNVRSLEAIA